MTTCYDERRDVAAVPVGVLERAGRIIDAHADEIIGRSHSDRNIAREERLRALSRALHAAARVETVDWRPLGAELTTTGLDVDDVDDGEEGGEGAQPCDCPRQDGDGC